MESLFEGKTEPVEIPEVILDLVDRFVKSHDSVKDRKEFIALAVSEILEKHDHFGELHVPLGMFFTRRVEDIKMQVKLLNTIDWYGRESRVREAVEHLNKAAEILNDIAKEIKSDF